MEAISSVESTEKWEKKQQSLTKSFRHDQNVISDESRVESWVKKPTNGNPKTMITTKTDSVVLKEMDGLGIEDGEKRGRLRPVA